MRTIFITCIFLFGVTIANGQITVNEKAVKNLSIDTIKNETVKYNFNLKSFNAKASETIKQTVKVKLEALSVSLTKPEMVSITEEQKTELEKLSQEIEGEVTVDEETIKNNLFYYEYFEDQLSKAKETYNSKLASKKDIKNDLTKLYKLNQEVEVAKADMNKYKKIIKDLDVINYKISDEQKWFPSAEPDQRDDFFEKLYSKDEDKNNYLLNNVSAQLGSNSATITSELLASYIKFMRVSFGTLISNTENDTEETPTTGGKAEGDIETDETDAFQRLLSGGGGNLYLNFELPLYYLQSSVFTTYLNGNARGGLVLDQFSDDVDTSSGNGNIGLNLYSSLSTDDKKSFIFFINANFGGYSGGTDFYKKLNLSENKIFAFGQATIGVDIAKSIRVSYTIGTVGSDESLRSTRGIVGIQLLKELFGK